MFRDDFEFNDSAGPSHLNHGGHVPVASEGDSEPRTQVQSEEPEVDDKPIIWLAEAERELKKVPFFVRGKARRNTEKFAAELGLAEITMETLYEAKSHFSR